MIPAEDAAALPAAFDRASVSAHALVRCALDSPLGESHLIASGARVVVLTRSSSFEPFRFVELEDGSVRYEREAFSRTLTLKTREGREHRIDVSILDVASVEAFVAALGGASPEPAPKPATSPIAPASSSLGPSSSPFGPSSSPFSAPFAPIAPEPIRLSAPPPLEIPSVIVAPSAADPATTSARTDLVTLLARRAARLEAKAPTKPPKPQEQRKPKQGSAAPTQAKPRKQKQAAPARKQDWRPPSNPARRAELEAQMRAAAAGEPEPPHPTSGEADGPLFRRSHLIALLVGVPLLWTLAQLVARVVMKR